MSQWIEMAVRIDITVLQSIEIAFRTDIKVLQSKEMAVRIDICVTVYRNGCFRDKSVSQPFEIALGLI